MGFHPHINEPVVVATQAGGIGTGSADKALQVYDPNAEGINTTNELIKIMILHLSLLSDNTFVKGDYE